MRAIYSEAIARFPDGTKVRHKQTGAEGVVGSHTGRFNRCSFWVMILGSGPKKGKVGATTMLRDFEVIQ